MHYLFDILMHNHYTHCYIRSILLCMLMHVYTKEPFANIVLVWRVGQQLIVGDMAKANKKIKDLEHRLSEKESKIMEITNELMESVKKKSRREYYV